MSRDNCDKFQSVNLKQTKLMVTMVSKIQQAQKKHNNKETPKDSVS